MLVVSSAMATCAISSSNGMGKSERALRFAEVGESFGVSIRSTLGGAVLIKSIGDFIGESISGTHSTTLCKSSHPSGTPRSGIGMVKIFFNEPNK